MSSESAPLSLVNLNGRATIRGVEGDIRLKLTNHWTLTAGSAFTIGEGLIQPKRVNDVAAVAYSPPKWHG